jgi:ATP/maltotriose-dependent transcriptional regulator MalT
LWRLAGDIAVARGDLAAAAESVASIRAVLVDARYHDQYHLPLGRLEIELLLAQDRPAEARSTVEDVLDRYDIPASPRYAWPLLVAGARVCTAAAAAAARDTALIAKAAAIRGRLRSQAGRLAVEGRAQQAHRLTFAAEACRADHALAGAGHGELPQSADVRTAWDEAAQAWEAAGQPYPLAVALLRSAEAALKAGDRDGGATRLHRAAALAQRLGARPLGDDITLLARRARISLGSPGDDAGAQAAPGGTGHTQVPEPERLGLTTRELEVLRLVAAGRSNREIAGELFISAKTASVHVSNILGKLSVTNRGEAAATAHRLRLFDSFPP